MVSCEWFIKPPAPCACCGRPFMPIPIGVSAIGWAFSFNSPPFKDGDPVPDMTIEAWRPHLVGQIITDGSREWTPEQFEAFVDRKKNDRKDE